MGFFSNLKTAIDQTFINDTGLTTKSHTFPSIIQSESDFSGSIRDTENDAVYMESYQKSVWVASSVISIAASAAQVPIKVFRHLPGNKEREVTTDQKFKFLQFPNQQTSRYRFYEAAFSYLILTGDVYIECFPNRENPTALFLLRPDYMKPIPSSTNLIGGYKFDPRRIFDNKSIEFDLNEIAHFHTFNPFSQFEGQSALRPATLSITADLLAQHYNNAFFENAARPEGIYRTDRALNDASYKRLEDRLIKLRQGFAKQHSPLLLDGGLDYKAISLGPKDVEFVEGRQLNRQDLLAALRVTPVQVGLSEANYAEAKQMTVVFNRNTIAPLLQAFSEDLTTHIVRFIDSQAFVKFDSSEVESFYEDRAAKEQRIVRQYLAGIITLDQVLQDLNRDPVGGELGEMRVLPSNFITFNSNELPESQQPSDPSKDIFDNLVNLVDNLQV